MGSWRVDLKTKRRSEPMIWASERRGYDGRRDEEGWKIEGIEETGWFQTESNSRNYFSFLFILWLYLPLLQMIPTSRGIDHRARHHHYIVISGRSAIELPLLGPPDSHRTIISISIISISSHSAFSHPFPYTVPVHRPPRNVVSRRCMRVVFSLVFQRLSDNKRLLIISWKNKICLTTRIIIWNIFSLFFHFKQ